jgi:glycosyltransferase involved in cell wall biosynthesis
MARFVAVNWRDLRNPFAGGAEVHLHEILRRMVAKGHQVTLFASGFPGCAETDEHDGIRIIRAGTWYNANYVLPWRVRNFVRKNPVDLIIDDVNKIPFLLPAVTNARVLPVIPHLFGSTVFRETNVVFASYVYLWEQLIPFVYRRCRFVVISPSTRDDLVGRGIPTERIDVVLCGLDHSTYRRIDGVERFTEPTIVHFGRMRKYKSIDVVVRAFDVIRRELPNARLIIVGDGPEKGSIVRLVEKLGLTGCVSFPGVVTTGELVTMLNRVHLFLNASPKEGWGLTVVEANACGVPVVASDRPGLRDSVKDGETGFLVKYGDPAAFARRSLEVLRDPERWRRMSAAGVAWAQSMTWDRTAREMEHIFLREIR